MSFAFLDRWHSFLPRGGGHVVAFAGSGGKTSLMRAVAAVLATEGLTTVLTTTTNCEELTGVPALSWAEYQAREPGMVATGTFIHSGRGEPGKWGGLSAGQVDVLSEEIAGAVVLVEVDGAAKHPLKLYRLGEPVWPERTSLVIVAMGVAAVGGQAAAGVHRWGEIDWPPFAGLPDYTVLEWSHLNTLLFATGGYLDQVPPAVPAVLALTHLDAQEDAVGLFEFLGQVVLNPALPLVMLCSMSSGERSIRTAFEEGRS